MLMRKWSLTMENMAPSDDGNYTCIVSNINGQINYTYIVTVIGKRLYLIKY